MDIKELISEFKDKAYDEGWNAFWKKISSDANPYTEQELYDEWICGWLAAQDAEMNEL